MTQQPAVLLPDAYLEEDIAVLGRKGGGKTYTSKGIVERLLDMQRRVLILDPLGVWAGLRTAADGKGPGYPVAIFGGVHGDLPLELAAAVPMAEVIASNNVPAVLDISDLSKTAQQSFLLAFLRELRRVNKDALTIVLEEADVFAPQNPMGDDSKALHAEIDWIARRGRFRGFRLITITQRPARLSKDVLTQAATLVMHRLPAPQDRDAAKAWIDGNGDRDQAKEVFDTLARLPVGEAWVWSTVDNELCRQRFPKIKTLDTSATPKAGEARIEQKTLAQVDIGPIEAAMAAARDQEKQASQKTDGKGKTIATLNGVKEPDPAALAAAERAGYERGQSEAAGVWLRRGIEAAVHRFKSTVEDFNTAAVAQEELAHWKIMGAIAEDVGLPAGEPARMAKPSPAAPPKPKPMSDGSLDGAAIKLLAAIARYDAISWDNACIVAGMLSGNGYFYKGKKMLVEGGFVCERDGLVALTDEGSEKAEGLPREPLTLADIVATWSGKVTAPGGPMLQHLAKHRRKTITTEELSEAIGAKPGNGYWYKGVKAIRNPGLIEDDRGKSFRLSEFLREAA